MNDNTTPMKPELLEKLEGWRCTEEEYYKLCEEKEYAYPYYGNYEFVKLTVWELLEQMRINPSYAVALYDEFLLKAIINEGFNENQASRISYEAYSMGHSSGYQEVVMFIQQYVEFIKEVMSRA